MQESDIFYCSVLSPRLAILVFVVETLSARQCGEEGIVSNSKTLRDNFSRLFILFGHLFLLLREKLKIKS